MSAAWGPPRGAAAGLAVLAVVLVALTLATDPAGRLLLGVAALLSASGAVWLLGGPALRADDDGVRVRGALRTHEVAWSGVDRVLVDSRRRSRAVELETDEGLLAVPALLLGGVSPEQVATHLRQLQARQAR